MVVSHLLRPILGRQEASSQFRYVEGVWNFYFVCSAIVIIDLELPTPLISNPCFMPSTALILTSFRSSNKWGELAMQREVWQSMLIG